MSKKKAKLVRPICSVCGSEEVRRDAYAAWDVEKQEWVLLTVFDTVDCEQCGGACSVVYVPAGAASKAKKK